jgi:glycosyltransferase involved in cell wall biosynthesis
MKRCCLIRQADYPACSRLRKEAAALAAKGCKVDIICLHSGEHKMYERINGISIHRIRLKSEKKGVGRYLYEYGIFFCLAAVKLFFLYCRKRFEVIQVNTMPDFLVFVTAIPKLFGAKVILDLHEPSPELFATLMQDRHPIILRLVKLFEQISIRFADSAITVSEQMKENYVRRGAPRSKISVILNVPALEFDHEAFAGVRRDDPTRFSLVCHGAMLKRYGQDVAIRAVDIVRARISNVVLNILGYGEYERELKALAESLGLNSHVRFHGYLPFNDMIRTVAGADVGIVPVEKNAYSDLVHTNKMFELIALHKPVIISRTNAVEHFFGSGDDCLKYFRSGDAEDLARSILELHHNPDKREEMARNAYARYVSSSWKITQEKYCRILENALVKH